MKLKKLKDIFSIFRRKKREAETPPIDPGAWPTPENLDQWEAMQHPGQTEAAGAETAAWPASSGAGETAGWDAQSGAQTDAAASWPSPDDAGA
ncbi:MAG: hypothetical protein IJU66_03105, partial [Oscillospiraceae bacterium]|nr:hypothetical protein [Oscillospiraceae bacterium]